MASKKTGSLHLTAMPARHWFYRASVIMMMTFAAVMLMMSKTGNPAIVKLRTSIADIVAPVLAVAASPMNAVADIGAWFGEMADLHARNIALSNENRQLLQWQAVAKRMEAENASLRSLLNVVVAPNNRYITARIVSDLGGPYAHSALLGAGSEQGVAKDQAVINENGLIGRVIETGKTSARVLLLGDMNSRIPVMIEGSHEKGILAGSDGRLPVLTYLAKDSTIAVGDRIVTSGDGGVFPRGIAVGIVSLIEKDTIAVQLFADPAQAEYVSIVDYSL
jgi:rod shape-determining protein MreC